MLVKTSTEWKKHSQTGRFLNMFKDSLQESGNYISSSKNRANLEETELANQYAEMYISTQKRVNNKAVDLVRRLLMRLIRIRNTDRVVQVNGVQVVSQITFRRVVEQLESMGLVEIFQGYATSTGSRPMAVKLAVCPKRVERELLVIRQNMQKD